MSQSVERALQILLSVGEQPRTVKHLADSLEVHPTTALRLVHTLRTAGFVQPAAAGTYRLGSAVLALGQRALESLDLRDVAQPHLQRLHTATNETVHLAILESDHVVYIDKVESQHPIRMYSRIGLVAPLYCTGVAKAILAHLSRGQLDPLLETVTFQPHTERTHTSVESLLADLDAIRERGYAMDDEEHEPGIHCVAAPFLGADGGVLGSISVSTPTSRLDRDALLALVPNLLEVTAKLESDLGYTSD